MAKKRFNHNPSNVKKVLPQEVIKAPHLGLVFLCLFLIVAAGILAYSNSFKNPFIWDDHLYIKDNYPVQDIRNIPSLFTRNITTLNENNFYRPLQMMTYTLNYTFSKLDVTAYHVTNTLIHILVGLSVFWLGLILSRSVLLSAVAGLLFVVHPIHVEAVSYISGRADSMAACFLLWSVILYIKHTQKQKIYFLILSVFAFALGLLCKENVAITPLLILAYDFIYHGPKLSFLKLSPFFIITIIYVSLRQTVLHFETDNLIANQTQLSDRIPLIFDSLAKYINKLLLPLDLHMEYPLHIPPLASWGVFFGLIVLGGLIYLIIHFRNKNKLLSFTAAWFLIMFVPISNIFPLNAFFYEHWVYTPSIGLFILAGWVIQRLFQRGGLVKWGALLVVGIALSLSIYLTIRQNYYWSDTELFFKRTLQYNPNSGRLNSELALYYILNDRVDEGIKYAERALEIDPDFYIVNVNLASAYMRKGMIEKSIEQSKRAIALKPDSAPARINLANAYMRKAMYDEAFVEFKKAEELNPELPEAFNGLCAANIQKGNYEQAIENCNKAIAIKPEYSDPYNNRGIAYERMGDNAKAIADYNKAVGFDPKNSFSYNNRAKAHYKERNFDEAIIEATKAIEANPKDALAYNIRGLAYNEKREYDKAISDYTHSIELNPNNSELYYNRGLCYDLKGESPKAFLDYSKAIEINPREPLAYNNRGAIQFQNNNIEGAIEDFSKAIEINPQNAEAYNNRATIYSRKANYDQALIDYAKAIELNPHYPEAYGNLALLYYFKGDFNKSWENLHKAQSIGYKVNPNFLNDLQKASGGIATSLPAGKQE